ncbi:MAG TPA: S-methyl-5-thioribose-1-phosphate isomerase [Spirochaetales bacterium]|nr:S-methyl-5-thioribose-1-phosphate isomerase [Spirochaetales bacterium]
MGETMTGAGGLPFETLRWSGGELYLLDQTRLPAELVEERQGSAERVWESIRALKVRGAPAIGVAAAYGLALGLRERRGASFPAFLDEARRIAAYLASARPTAVNLEWALRRMVGFAEARAARSASVPALYEALVGEAIRIHEEDKATCRAIGEAGACLVAEGSGILTHCNAGALATTGIGTATAPLYLAHAAGRRFRVYADETRPLLQGARLTAWELSRSGLDVTLLCEGMAAHALSKGLVQLCIVGCDRVAANGDAANKIGTLGLAVLARHFGVPFYVACPSSTLDLATPRGEDIVIEERDPAEVTSLGGRRVAPEGVRALNPAFDVTPRELISGFVTEAGILRPPFEEGFRALAGER